MRRFLVVVAMGLSSACSGGLDGTSAEGRHLKIAEEGGPYISDVVSYQSLGQKSLKRGQKYRITEVGDRHAPFFLVADVTKYVGGKKDDVTEGASIYVEDGIAEYDCSKWMSDRKISESNDDTPVVSCNFKFVGMLPIATSVAVEKAE